MDKQSNNTELKAVVKTISKYIEKVNPNFKIHYRKSI